MSESCRSLRPVSRSGNFLAHPVHAALRDLRATISSVPAETREAIEALGPGEVLSRAEVVIDAIEGLLTVVDPDLVSIGMLDRVDSHIAPIRQTVSAQPMDDASWVAIDKLLDEACAAASGLSVASGPLKNLVGAASGKVGRAVSTRLSELDSATSESKSELVELREQIEEVRGEAETARTQLVESTESSTEALSSQIVQLQAQVNEFLSAAQREHTSAQQTRDDAAAAAEDYRASEFTALVESQQQTLDERLQKLDATTTAKLQEHESTVEQTELLLRARAEQALKDIDAIKVKVEGLYGAITQTGTAGAFGNEAREQAKVADNWRLIAIGFAVAAILSAGASAALVVWGDAKDVTAAQIVAKIVFTLVLGGAATYSASQSSRHRQREESAKQLELDLRAIAPFLEEIPDDEGARTEARTAFIERWMASRTEPAAAPKDSLAGLSVETISQLAAAINNRGGQQ